MSGGGRGAQLPMALGHEPALGREDFLVSPANADAVRLVLGWRNWPGRRLALVAPARAGKTHLAHVWMRASGAQRVTFAELAGAAVERLAALPALVIEDIDSVGALTPDAWRRAGGALLEILNLAAAGGQWLLLTGRDAPARWPAPTADLASRLAALPLGRIGPPDDALLAGVMVKLFADRQLRVAPGVIAFLAARIERSFAAAEAAVAALDARALAEGRGVTRALAAAWLDEMARTQGGAGESG